MRTLKRIVVCVAALSVLAGIATGDVNMIFVGLMTATVILYALNGDQEGKF